MSEGMRNQTGVKKEKKRVVPLEGSNQVEGIKSKTYYLDVIFAQLVLLLLLYGVCVLVVPKLV